MTKIKPGFSDAIADTLFITLCAKSVESKKKHPLIKDEKACELVAGIDYDFSKFRNAKTSTTGVAIRAAYFDEVVRNFIEHTIAPVVVLVGCGLDTRVHRLGNISNRAFFYHLDLPEVIPFRESVLPPAVNESYIAASMLDTSWMGRVQQEQPNSRILIIIEGVLMYFNEADNRFVFKELANRFPGAVIHFDMLNKWMSRKSAVHDTVRKTKAVFKYGVNNIKEMEQWSPKLKHLSTKHFYEFKGWHRMGWLLSTLMLIIPALKNSARLISYGIKRE